VLLARRARCQTCCCPHRAVPSTPCCCLLPQMHTTPQYREAQSCTSPHVRYDAMSSCGFLSSPAHKTAQCAQGVVSARAILHVFAMNLAYAVRHNQLQSDTMSFASTLTSRTSSNLAHADVVHPKKKTKMNFGLSSCVAIMTRHGRGHCAGARFGISILRHRRRRAVAMHYAPSFPHSVQGKICGKTCGSVGAPAGPYTGAEAIAGLRRPTLHRPALRLTAPCRVRQGAWPCTEDATSSPHTTLPPPGDHSPCLPYLSLQIAVLCVSACVLACAAVLVERA
jgi:hypothetical protein